MARRGRHAAARRGPAAASSGVRRPLWWRLGILAFTAVAVVAVFAWPRAVAAPTLAVQVSPPTYERELGAPGPGALVEPVGVAWNRSAVYVADARRAEVVVFASDGRFAAAFGKGRLKTPTYMAFAPVSGRLYVCDRGLHAVLVFAEDGSFVDTFAPDPTDARAVRALASWQPLGIAFSEDGIMYVSDSATPQKVLAFSPTKKLLAQTGSDVPPGPTGERIAFANGIAAEHGRVFVTDSNNGRLLLLGSDLSFQRAVALEGLPRGLCTIPGSTGNLLAVVDTTDSVVRILDGAGAQVASGDPGAVGKAAMSSPSGIAADGAGFLYVADSGERRIAVWRAGGVLRKNLWLDTAKDPRAWAAGVVILLGVIGQVVVHMRHGKRAERL